MPAKLPRPSPQPMTLTAISGTDEWRALLPTARRTFVLWTENGFHLEQAVRSANSMDKTFQEENVEPTVQHLLADENFLAAQKMFTEPVVGIVARAS
jgi:hypothetical protein